MLATGLTMFAKYRALFLYPWDLASIAWMKNSDSHSDQILSLIPVVQLYDFSHPDKIPEKDFPFAIDGETYYFTKQVRRDASGNRSQRKAGEQGAYWKSTSRDIDIKHLDEKPIGYMRKYALYEDKDCKRSANWYMEEYRATDHKLVDPYVLCKIYDKDSQCPKYTKTSIRALRDRFIERQHGSHLDKTDSLFDNRNQSQTQFDVSDSHEVIIPTSHDASGNQNCPEAIPSSPWSSNPMYNPQIQSDNYIFVEDTIMQQTLPTFENFPPNSLLIPRPHDASGNQNHPESLSPIPILMDQSQTQFDDDCSYVDLIMQQTFPTCEIVLSDPIPPSIPCSSFCSNESLYMNDASFSGPSMPHYSFEKLNAPDGEESPPDLCNQFNF